MYNSKFDLLFTEDGEIIFDRDQKDFQKAYESEYETLTQTILKRVQSSEEDWNLDGAVGANLNYLLGSPANEAVVEEARNFIYSALTSDGYIDPDKLKIQSDPFNSNILMFNVSVFVNDNDFYNVYNLGFSYNTRDNRCTPRYIKEMSG
jgi:hypothetical protein